MGLYKRGRKWWLDEVQSDGKRIHRSLKTADKRIAEANATTIRDEHHETARRKRLKLPDTSSHEETAMRPPLLLVEDYLAELTRRGRDALHVEITGRRLKRIFAGVACLADMSSSDAVCAALTRTSQTLSQGFTKTGEARKMKTLSGRSQNYYRLALSAFFNWLVKGKKWPENPVKAVERVTESEPARPRRALTLGEVQALLESMKTGPAAYRVQRRRRRALYLLAFVSGLRRGEVGKLKWRDCDLDRATLLSRPSTSKNNKAKTHALPPATVEALLEIRGEAKPDDLVFPVMPLLKTFYADLDKAKVRRETAEGKVDFHAWGRTSRATALATEGVSLTTNQKMMRHSSPGLTSGAYVRLGLDEERAAAAKLEAFAGATVGEIVGSERRQGAPSCGYEDGQPVASESRAETEAANPRGVGRMDGPGIEPGTPGFSVLATHSPTQASKQAVSRGAPPRCGGFWGEHVRHEASAEDLARLLLEKAATVSDAEAAALARAAKVLLDQAKRGGEGIIRMPKIS